MPLQFIGSALVAAVFLVLSVAAAVHGWKLAPLFTFGGTLAGLWAGIVIAKDVLSRH